MWVEALFVLTALLYAVAFVRFVIFLFGRAATALPASLPHMVTAAALLHALHIVFFSLLIKVCPVEGVHFPLSVASMLTCVLYVALRRRYRIDAAGAVVTPFALTTLLASRFVGGGILAPGPRVRSAILPFHVTMNLLGVALFTLAASSAMLYLVQERRLKEKRLTGLFQRLPALDTLDRAEHRLLLAGFPLLTFGIISGTVWATRLPTQTVADLIRDSFGYVTWLMFASVLLSRAVLGWRGRRAAWGTLAGFAFTIAILLMYLLRPGATPAS